MKPHSLKYYAEHSFLNSSDTGIFHGFFTRLGGVSVVPFEGLNCGVLSGDDPDNVQKNSALVAEEIGIEPDHLLAPHQVHGSHVVYADAPWAQAPKADGVVTDKPGIALTISTADCAPVLFYGKKDDDAPVIGAAHAGWKGALTGVLDNTVKTMESCGAIKETLRACVGPCISKSSYEVDNNFITAFIEEHEDSERFFQSVAKKGHAMFDLSGYCAWRLFRAGVKNVALLDMDTYGNEKEFFSYRRATHRNEPDYGRQISVISINT